MIKVINIDEISQKDWNEHVKHPVQTYEWAQFRRSINTEVVLFGEYDDQQLIRCYLMTVHVTPYIHKKLGYIGMCDILTQEFIDFLELYAEKQKIFFVKVEPYLLKNENHKLPQKLQKSFTHNFYEWTFLMNISGENESISQSFKKECRYSIRVAQKNEIQIKIVDSKDGHQTFLRLLDETAKRQGFGYHSKDYHEKMWERVQKNLAHILIAYHNEKPVAALELFYFKGRLYYPFAGNDYESRSLMASNLLISEAVKYGKTLGATTFDLWGAIDPKSQENSAWRGFSKFKESFGGDRVQLVGSFDLVISNYLYTIYKYSHKARIFLKNKFKM